VLILVMAAVSWADRRRLPHSPWWATATLVWVLVQGLFGKYTVTLKLYPAVVTAHLLGGMALLALLVIQHETWRGRTLGLPRLAHAAAWAVAGLLVVQIALGGWVSTNYAVLACQGFPTCNGSWWPPMQWAEGFTVLRELGRAGHGGYLGADALVAIHMAHRIFAGLLFAAITVLVVLLWRSGGAAARRAGLGRARGGAAGQRPVQRLAWLAARGGARPLGGRGRDGGRGHLAAGACARGPCAAAGPLAGHPAGAGRRLESTPPCRRPSPAPSACARAGRSTTSSPSPAWCSSSCSAR
jgi:hypothetical protein